MRKTITICGSMQFVEQMKQLRQELQSKGYEVYIPDDGEEGVSYDELEEAEQIALKGRFIDSHLDYIRESDAILVANFVKKGITGCVRNAASHS